MAAEERLEAAPRLRAWGETRETEDVHELKEVHLVADPERLRAVGEFILECADEMVLGKPYHRHLKDVWKGWDSAFVDLIVNVPED